MQSGDTEITVLFLLGLQLLYKFSGVPSGIMEENTYCIQWLNIA